MENENEEVVDNLEIDEEQEETYQETEEDTTDWQAKAKELEGRLKRAVTKLSKKSTPEKKEEKQSNEPDYAKMAFLEQKGVKHPDDQKLVQDEANRLKLPLTDILGMEYVQAKLKAANNQREAEEGMPKGKGRAGETTKSEVDYWLARGETPDDQELAEKVIAARIKQETSKNMFSDDLF